MDYIDIARGLYVTWMVTAHALTLAGIPSYHWMQYLRPTAWASTGFVILAGFTLAVLQVPRGEPVLSSIPRLWRRAAQLGLIAYASNLASSLLVAAAAGTASTGYAADILAFRVPWSISGILVPIALIVFGAPALLALARRTGPAATFLCVLVFNAVLLSDLPVGGSLRLSQVTASTGPFSFAVVHLTGLAVLGFGAGTLVARGGASTVSWAVPAGVVGAVTLAFVPMSGGLANATVVLCARFAVVLGASSLLTCPALGVLMMPIRVLGQAALVVFLGHRLLLHVGRWLAGSGLHPEFLAVILIVLGLGSSLVVAAVRVHVPAARIRLKAIGL